jgi:hypothetical protein
MVRLHRPPRPEAAQGDGAQRSAGLIPDSHDVVVHGHEVVRPGSATHVRRVNACVVGSGEPSLLKQRGCMAADQYQFFDGGPLLQ